MVIYLPRQSLVVSLPAMKPETKKLLEETKQRLFESDEFKVSREHVQWVQPNFGEPDNLDTLLNRIEQFAPSMQRWADSFNEPQKQRME
jgi:hypothetical protein